MQNWSWCDYMELLIPEAIVSASLLAVDTSLRQCLPRNFLSYMGTMHQPGTTNNTHIPKNGEADNDSIKDEAPGSARGRVSLLHQALECNLAPFLLESILDLPYLSSCKDPASAKVHAVDLCKLLILDPGYGMKFELILEGLPGWKKYGSQDHSLFITGSEQKADYFLTNGENSEPMKLLTGS